MAVRVCRYASSTRKGPSGAIFNPRVGFARLRGKREWVGRMKCEQVSIHQTGGPEALIYEEVELPPLKPGQALVRQTAIGLNFIDTYHRSGLYPLPQLPHAIGTEAAGVVEELGPGVSGLKLGQRVAYVSGPPGAYANLRAYSA